MFTYLLIAGNIIYLFAVRCEHNTCSITSTVELLY